MQAAKTRRWENPVSATMTTKLTETSSLNSEAWKRSLLIAWQ